MPHTFTRTAVAVSLLGFLVLPGSSLAVAPATVSSRLRLKITESLKSWHEKTGPLVSNSGAVRIAQVAFVDAYSSSSGSGSQSSADAYDRPAPDIELSKELSALYSTMLKNDSTMMNSNLDWDKDASKNMSDVIMQYAPIMASINNYSERAANHALEDWEKTDIKNLLTAASNLQLAYVKAYKFVAWWSPPWLDPLSLDAMANFQPQTDSATVSCAQTRRNLIISGVHSQVELMGRLVDLQCETKQNFCTFIRTQRMSDPRCN